MLSGKLGLSSWLLLQSTLPIYLSSLILATSSFASIKANAFHPNSISTTTRGHPSSSSLSTRSMTDSTSTTTSMPTRSNSSNQEIQLMEMTADATHQDYNIWKFLGIAAHEESTTSVDEIRSSTELARYGNISFGNGDLGWVASTNENTIVGAAWVRFWNASREEGYAYIGDPDIPELAMGVCEESRGQGVGSQLLQRVLDSLEAQGVPGLCLSVRDNNHAAIRLYEKLGFRPVEGTDVANRVGGRPYNMIKLFDPNYTLIRRATKADLPTILELIQLQADYDDEMSPPQETNTVVATPKLLQEAFFPDPSSSRRGPSAHVLLVEQAGEILGFAIYYFRFSSFAGLPQGWLEDLYFRPEGRSKGMGTKLMHRLQEEVCRLEPRSPHISWLTRARNKRGQAFYERLGAKIVGTNGDILTYQWKMNQQE